MADTELKSIHYTQSLPSDPSKGFTITCPPRTDIWNKPPETHSFNAPIIYHAFPTLSQFKSVTVTISSSWAQKYDQGGLCLIVNPSTPGHKSTWLKTGIEFFNSQAQVSTVETRTWSDWSLRPLTIDEKGSSTSSSATVKIVNNAKDDGSLWVYLQSPDGSWTPIREVTWWADLDDKSECWVGAYAARVAEVDESFDVHFEGFKVESETSS